MTPRLTPKNWPFVRDVASFFLGAAGLAFEATQHPPQYVLIPVFGGLVGAPAFIRKVRNYDDEDDNWREE